MRVLVTGANGFVGRALVPVLTGSGYEVRAAGRDLHAATFPAGIEVAVYDAGMQDGDLATLAASCDAVVHLAGIAHTGPGIADEVYRQVNHLATTRLARAAEAAGVKHFIFISSVRAQSGPTADHVLTEDDPPHPSDAYGRSKLAAEHALRMMRIPHTILRPALIYGPGVKGNLAALTKLAALPIPLPLAGLARQRSLLGIDGLTSAIIFTLQNPAALGQTFLVADPTPLSVAEIVAALRHGFRHKPNLFRISPGVLRTAFTLIGKRGALDRLDGELIVSPRKLMEAGWVPIADTRAALAAVTQRISHSR